MAIFRGVVRIGANSRVCSSNKFGPFNYYSTSTSSNSYDGFRSNYRQISQLVKSNGKRAFLVDTLALVKSLEAQGVPSKQAEAITSAITEVLNDSLENVSHSFVSNAEMQKIVMLQESKLSMFKSEVQSSLEHHLSLWQREMEKLQGDTKREMEKFQGNIKQEMEKFQGDAKREMEKLQGDTKREMEKLQGDIKRESEKRQADIKSESEKRQGDIKRESEKRQGDFEKMRSDLRYEIDKVTAGQRLDLNLERGRIRDELSNQNAETTNLDNKLDREIHALRAQLEAAKYDVIKYCIGTLVSISAVGLAVVRILL